MDKIKVLFVGIGSIAIRHIGNLSDVLYVKGFESKIDVFRSGKGADLSVDLQQKIQTIYTEEKDIPNDYDILFITNPTRYHIRTLRSLHDKGKHFFIEKPICSLEELEELNLDFLRKDSIYYVASPLRYTKVIQYLKHEVDLSKVYSVRSISSSYLPDWRVECDYRTTYSAKKELGGGVSIDLIHEWDYLTYLFGFPECCYSIIDKISNLEINSDDIAIYIAKYCNKTVELHLDYFGRESIRILELFNEDDTIECDLIKSTITYLKSGKRITFGQERNDYQKTEMEYFIDLILSGDSNRNRIQEAIQVLRITGGIS